MSFDKFFESRGFENELRFKVSSKNLNAIPSLEENRGG